MSFQLHVDVSVSKVKSNAYYCFLSSLPPLPIRSVPLILMPICIHETIMIFSTISPPTMAGPK